MRKRTGVALVVAVIVVVGIAVPVGAQSPTHPQNPSNTTQLDPPTNSTDYGPVNLTTSTVTGLESGPSEVWNQTYGGTASDGFGALQETADGGYILAGGTESYGAGYEDAWLVKVDSEGTEEWNQTYGGSANESFAAVQETPDGGYIIAGSTESYGAGSDDAWLVKVDSEGNEVWNQTYGGDDSEWVQAVEETPDGYVLAGSTTSFGAGDQNAWLVKVDSEGTEQWNQTYGGSDHELLTGVEETPDGGYIFHGVTSSFGAGSFDAWLVKVDSEGTEQWNQTYGGGAWDGMAGVKETADGGYLVSGWTGSYGAGDWDAWLVKVDSTGIEEWNQTYGGSGTEWFDGIEETPDGGYIFHGLTDSYGAGSADAWLVKVDSVGTEEWNQTYGGSDGDIAWAMGETADGGYILAGVTSSFGAGSGDAWLVQVISPEPGVAVTDYEVSSTQLHPGEQTTVTATVENPTSNETTTDVTLFADGEQEASQSVTVPAESTETVEFTVSFDAIGTHTVTVDDLAPTEIQVAESDLILGDVEASADSTVTVQLYMDDATNIAGYSANFTFDPDVVQVQAVSGVDFNDPVTNIDNEAGWAFLTQSAATGQDNPVFAEITFEVVGAGGNATDLSFVAEETSVNDAQGADVSLLLHEGNVTVQACEPGDANGDGSVGPSDATITQRAIVGLPISGPFNPSCADIAPYPDGDGEISPSDVTLIQRKIVGLPPFATNQSATDSGT